MSKQAAVKIPEEEARSVKPSRQLDVRDDCPREEFELIDDPGPVDDPGSEEEPNGYGHGV